MAEKSTKKFYKMLKVMSGRIIKFLPFSHFLPFVRQLPDTSLVILRGSLFFIVIMEKEELEPLYVVFSYLWGFSSPPKKLWSFTGKGDSKDKIME